jgi:hypothetical protein
MSHENAPATKLLATNCACCGRALVDAVSVETGVGPDCREMHGYAEAQGDADWSRAVSFGVLDANAYATARDAVNALVHMVARSAKTLDRASAAAVFNTIDALGFSTLAERIAKRFHATLAARLTEEQLKALRGQYAKLRAEYCYDNATPAEFDAAVKSMNPTNPEDFVTCASAVTCECKACRGTGAYTWNGQPSGECYRCEGKGRQSHADAARNRAYDALNRRRNGRAA